MAEKKGFMHYLSNPAEAAKKLFPFIDVDAMMASNRERQMALGSDPDLASNVIGGALNPGLHATGFGIARGAQGLLSALHKRRAIKQLSKDILSPEGIQRYIKNSESSARNMLKELESKKLIYNLTLGVQRGRKQKGKWMDTIKDIDQQIKSTKGNLEYLKTPEFIDEYKNIVSHKMKNTPFRVSKMEPGIAGQYRSYGGLDEALRYPSTSAYPGYIGVPGRHRGIVELSPKTSLNFSSTTPLHEMKHSVQDALRGYQFSTKKSIPLNKADKPILLAKAELKDAMLGGDKSNALKELMRYQEAKYLLRPEEISARLSQIRTNPSKTSSAYRQLKQVFQTDKKVKWAKDNLWAASPAGLMDYARDNK